MMCNSRPSRTSVASRRHGSKEPCDGRDALTVTHRDERDGKRDATVTLTVTLYRCVAPLAALAEPAMLLVALGVLLVWA